jgi:undecaprenyl-diphosphatase
MTFLQILLLGLVQGAAELLPVSSSAHVIVVEKLLGLDPARPEMTFLLVMLHTGTMFAVIGYFWRAWRERYFSSVAAFREIVVLSAIATGFTGVVGLVLKHLIEKFFLGHGDIELLFGNLFLVGAALAAAGALILWSGRRPKPAGPERAPDWRAASWIGAVQGLCLPFRGFSRSGATISTGLLLGVGRMRLEEFSFALAVVLTPLAIGRELLRLVKAHGQDGGPLHFGALVGPGLLGMACSFAAGLLALKFLSRLLESGRWSIFGYYCLAAAGGVLLLAASGF